jgi:signal transduction histidine kinase
VLLVSVVRRCPVRTALRLGTALAIAAMAAPARDARPGPFTLAAAVLTVVVIAQVVSLRVHDARRVGEAQAVRALERRDLARELHDLVAHHVAGIVVLAQAGRFTAQSVQDSAQAFARIEAEGDEALAAMHHLVGLLRAGADTRPVAGMAQVGELVEAFARLGPPVVLQIAPGVAERVDEAMAVTVHRIVREALTNVRKHAVGATAVKVTIAPDGGRGLRVLVRDNGHPGPGPGAASRGGGFGLVGMGERAQILGGTITAGPMPETGWQVEALLLGSTGRRG